MTNLLYIYSVKHTGLTTGVIIVYEKIIKSIGPRADRPKCLVAASEHCKVIIIALTLEKMRQTDGQSPDSCFALSAMN